MKRFGFRAVLVFAALSACEQPEEILEGVRLDVRTPVGVSGSELNVPQTGAAPTALLSQARSISEWSHRGGNVQHDISNAAFGSSFSQAWATSIGAGETRRDRITADPVSDGARVYVIDANAQLSAVDLNGSIVWQRDLNPASEQSGLTSGGAVTVSGGTVFATSQYGVLSAIRANDGQLLWTQRLDAAPAGPPAVRSGLVYQITRDNRALAIEIETGRIRWQLNGIAATAGFSGGAGPAVSASAAIIPFSSGELIAVLRQGGARLWSSSISGARVGRVYAAIGDFATDPVIVGSSVYAGTHAGRIVALEVNSGERLWTAPVGTLGQILADGASLWVVSDEGKLTRINRSNGEVLWSHDLPYFTEEKVKKRKGIHAHYGPILAGGRLVLASSDGYLRTFDPTSGAMLAQVPIPSGAATAPIIVGETLYLVSEDGALRAFR